MLNEQEEFRRRIADSRLATLAKAVALSSAFVGIVAGYARLELSRKPSR